MTLWQKLTELKIILKWIYRTTIVLNCGPGSSDGIATDYELEGPGSNSGG